MTRCTDTAVTRPETTQASGTGVPGAGEQLAAAVTDLVREVVPRKLHDGIAITPDTELSSLGITSMAKISLASKLEERLGLDLALLGEGLADVRTVQDVLALVAKVMQASGG